MAPWLKKSIPELKTANSSKTKFIHTQLKTLLKQSVWPWVRAF